MSFPFSIKYSVQLGDKFTSEKNKETLEFIEEFITENTGEDIVIVDNKLIFKSNFFNWKRLRNNIFVPIEKGIFNIIERGDRTILTYEFSMYRLFIASIIISAFLATVSQHLWFGIFFFICVGGMNWLITIIRHKRMLNEIAKEIDNLINNTK